ncbi:MAG: hypothetical protein V1792_03000 [Pseudomonadota bacterium]
MSDNHRADALNLQSLAEGRPGITPTWGEVLSETAVVCLEDHQHSPGVALRIRGHVDQTCLLHWQNGDDQMRRCYNDAEYATEHGAYGIAILIAELITGLTVIERSAKGTHIDFWLGEDDEDAPPFVNEARLEVSGIRRGDDQKIAARLKQKLDRLEGADSRLTAFVIVVEFSRPVSEVQRR